MDKDGRLRFHQRREEKIFVLANDSLTRDPLIHDLSISQSGQVHERVLHLQEELQRSTELNVFLAKSLHQKLWDDSPFLLKQLPGIGMVTTKARLGSNLLDEELEAGFIGTEAEYDCQVVTEHVVFDLIHEKAKDFTVVATSSGVQSPSPDALKLIRTPIHDKRLQFQGMTEFSVEKGTKRKLLLIIASPFPETREPKPIVSLINEDADHSIVHPVSRSIDIINLIDVEGELPQAEEGTARSREEEIFNHIRKKFKTFPVIRKLNVDDESNLLTKECFLDNSYDRSSIGMKTSSSVNSSKSISNDLIILDPEPTKTKIDTSATMKDWKQNQFMSSQWMVTQGTSKLSHLGQLPKAVR